MKRYGHLLRNDPKYAERARAFAAKCRDISEVLTELGPVAPRAEVNMRIAYHDACHLQHAQGVRAQPRRLLQAIPGVDVREIAESEICCGSAGIYNLLEPEAATQLRDRKVQNIIRTGADVIVSGNPGCLLQIATGLEAAGRPLRIMHLVEVLDQSISQGLTHRASMGVESPVSSGSY
jgi:glycolate oxidase iron-sulfur subunit